MLALSAGGTIPDRGWFAVTLPDGTRLGELDEEFVFESRLGDKFYLGAFPWKIEEITRDRVIVSPTSPEGAASPFWKGDRAARAYETGAFYGSLLSKWEDAARPKPAALRAALCAAGLTPDAAENARARARKPAARPWAVWPPTACSWRSTSPTKRASTS